MAAPDYPAAADWYTRAADAGHGGAARNLAAMYAVGRGRAWQIMPVSSIILAPRYAVGRGRAWQIMPLACHSIIHMLFLVS